MMDILEIDAVNFSGRVAHVAAAELAGLLTHGTIRPQAGWFAGEVDGLPGDLLQDEIDRMAAYVAKRGCSGETLYRAFRAGEWGQREPWLRMSYDLFASTVVGISQKLLVAQADAERRLDEATRPAPPALKREDSIFEEVDGLGALRPEAVASAGEYAAYKKLEKQEARARRKATEAAEKASKLAAEHTAIELQKNAATPPAPLSIGEKPPAPPVNRGGRGRRKEG